MARKIILFASLSAFALALSGCAGIAQKFQSAGSSSETQRTEEAATLPHCPHSLGTATVREPQTNWWTPLNLPSPQVVLNLYGQQSGCFTVLDRGSAFEIAQQERALAAGGDLRQGSGIGKGQVQAADYVFNPNIVSQNQNSGGSSLFAVIGSVIDPTGLVGAAAGNLSLNSKKADVTLQLIDVRSSAQVGMAEATAEKTDLGFGFGGAGLSLNTFAAAGASGYANTDIGEVIAMAYLKAFKKVVEQAEASLPPSAKEANVGQAVQMARTGHLFAKPSSGSTQIRELPAGTTLYPTGQKSGRWWEVKDEMGRDGWVAEQVLGLAK